MLRQEAVVFELVAGFDGSSPSEDSSAEDTALAILS